MAKHTVLTVHAVQMGDPERGLWCRYCMLPSGLAVTFALQVGRVPMGVARFSLCDDCGRCLNACCH